MVYKILWKERYKEASYIATRDGKVVQVNTPRINHFLDRDIAGIVALTERLEARMTLIDTRTKL